jgi:hypothetical protein
MELEQRALIKYLRFKGLKLFHIHHELIFTFAEKAHTLVSRKHWIHELKTGEQFSQTNTDQGNFDWPS